MTAQFEVGKTYATRSLCDYDTIFRFQILARTQKTVTVNVNGKTARRGIYVYDDVERLKPFGSYSMAAIISADREETAKCPK